MNKHESQASSQRLYSPSTPPSSRLQWLKAYLIPLSLPRDGIVKVGSSGNRIHRCFPIHWFVRYSIFGSTSSARTAFSRILTTNIRARSDTTTAAPSLRTGRRGRQNCIGGCGCRKASANRFRLLFGISLQLNFRHERSAEAQLVHKRVDKCLRRGGDDLRRHLIGGGVGWFPRHVRHG